MNVDKYSDLLEKLALRMDDNRLKHTISVAETASMLADKYDASIDKAYIAGLLHDNAKCKSNDELIKECELLNIEIREPERRNPFLLHGKLGAYYAVNEFGISDEDVINAITWHTTGRPGMSLLEKIVFVADYIEPLRYKQKNLEDIRRLAYENIDKCVYVISKDTIEYVSDQAFGLDEMTIRTMEFYKEICEDENE